MGVELDETPPYEADSPLRSETPPYNSEGHSEGVGERTPPYEDFSSSIEKSDEPPLDEYEESAVPLKRRRMSEDFDYEEYDFDCCNSEDSDHQELSPEEEFKHFLESEKFVASPENFNKACGTENYYVTIYVDRVDSNSINVVDVYGHGDRKGMDPLTLESLRRASIEKRIELVIDGVMSRDTTKLLYSSEMNPIDDILLTKDEIQQLYSLLKWLAPSKCNKLYCHLFSSVADIAILINEVGFTTLTGIWKFGGEDLCLPVFENVDQIEVSVPSNWYSTQGARDAILNARMASVDLDSFSSEKDNKNEGFPFEVVQKLIEAWIHGAISFETRKFLTSFGMEEWKTLLAEQSPYRVRRLHENGFYWSYGNEFFFRRGDGCVMKVHYTKEEQTIAAVRFSCDNYARKKVEVVIEESEEKSPDQKLSENDGSTVDNREKEVDDASAQKKVPSSFSIAQKAPKHASTDFFNKVTSGQVFSTSLCVSRRESVVSFDLVYYDHYHEMIMDLRTLESLRKASIEKRIRLEISCVASMGELRTRSCLKMKPIAMELVLTKEEARQLHEFLQRLAPKKCGKLFCNLLPSVEDVESLINEFGFTDLAGLWRFSGDDLFRTVFKKLDSMKLFMPLGWFLTPRALEFMLTTNIRDVETSYTWIHKYEARKAFPFEIMQEFIESWLAGKTFQRRVFEASFLVEDLLDYVKENFNVEYGQKLRPGGIKITEEDDDDYEYWEERTEETEEQKKAGVCVLRRADDGNQMTIKYDHKRWGTINIEISCEEKPITADDISDKEDDDASSHSNLSASPVKESDLPKYIDRATIENFNKATGQEVFDVVIYVSRLGGITFDVNELWGAEEGMDLLTLDSLRKASFEKRVQLKINRIASRGALKRINSWEMEPEHAREIVLTRDETRQLHSFLKWLAPASCRDLFCQLVPSIEDIEQLVNKFGFTSLDGIWEYPAEYLQREAFEKLDCVALTVPLKLLSTPGARDFILNTKIPYVNLKYYKRDEDRASQPFALEIVEKLIESWLDGATFRGRVFEAGFEGMALKKFIEERFTIVKKRKELQPGTAVCVHFSAYEEEEHVDWAVYNILRDDGAVLKVDYNQEKDWTPYEIELSCEKKRGKKN